jgi:hypothetical protein
MNAQPADPMNLGVRRWGRLRWRLKALVLFAAAALSLALAPGAHAGMVTDCNHLPDFEGADVTTLILQYEYAGRPDDPLSEAARNLSLLIQVDALLTQLKYRNIGVAFVQTDHYAPIPCTPERVAQRMLEHIPSGRGIVILSGRLFEVEDRLYLQSSVLFLRKDVQETLVPPQNPDLPEGAGFIAALPQAPVAFAPRLLLKADLDAINVQFRKAMVVRNSPSYDAPGTPIELGGDIPFAYSVVSEQQGWMYIKPFRDFPGPEGWINFGDPAAHADLHRRLPELDYLDATVAYLQSRIHGSDGGAPSTGQLLEWAQSRLMRFGEITRQDGASNADRAAIGIGLGMVGILQTEHNGWGKQPGGANPFGAMVAAMPYSADARNLASLVDIYNCCLAAARTVGPEKAERSLLDALSVDPGNSAVLANLKSFYLRMQNRADLRSPTLDDAVLARRLKAVEAVQQAQQ